MKMNEVAKEETRIKLEKEMNEDLTNFCEFVKMDNWVYCIPSFENVILKVDTNTKERIEIEFDMNSNLSTRRKFSHAVLVGKSIYCFPKNYPTILKINTETDELENIEFSGDDKKHEFNNITVVNKDIFFIYKNTEKLLKLTTANDSIRSR